MERLDPISVYRLSESTVSFVVDLSSLSFLQLVWLNPDNNHELLWDYGMCADTSRGAAVRDLISKALKGPLAPAQQEVLDYN